MKIALLGYGKMGKVIEQLALQRGHEIVLKKSSESNFEITPSFRIINAMKNSYCSFFKNNYSGCEVIFQLNFLIKYSAF